MKNKISKFFVMVGITLSSLLYLGCTNLDETVYNQITPETFFKSEEEFFAALVPLYAQLRPFLWSYYNLSQVSSDETIVPTRGGDWGDGGRWRAMYQHTWDKTLPDVNDAWNDAFTGVARANSYLKSMELVPNTSAAKPRFVAEARVLRGLYYYLLMDLFGGVPIVTDLVDRANPPARNSRQEVFNFIEKEVTESIAALPEAATGDSGRLTKNSARALLARMYLNAGVFTGSAQWQKTLDMCDAIINSGVQKLEGSFFDNFIPTNEKSKEGLLVIGYANIDLGFPGMNFTMRTGHYNQVPQSPWNGFCTIAEYYDSFDPQDVRSKMFQAGQAVNLLTGEPVNNRQGAPLIFTKEVPIENANEGNGIRVLKWGVDPLQNGGDSRNDFFVFRYSEIFLTKAEALNELGRTTEATALINVIRGRAFNPAKPLSSSFTQATFRQQILKERGFELGWEASRRQDLIRIGGYTAARTNKLVSQSFRNLFPIPQRAIDANPKLSQNPGY
ncbi:MAG: RagB/SusD family nutrient uptake outer membrane protein [Cytophagales bacterium]|nr:MAG: RagB/SusD family nutrient uptake outer membrane protein [Cytophagales bacterium]